ncbi:uncharacterized protein LOC107982225 [Nasonia vitripennis]|uniref:Uncharacterized protein n=1 Tax=Nasonia vitripennis TaxID=7425 RepID=A0A7M7IVD2_NASVI|nr:uncharacterized protein LOC107982225 [Nasonia vitripennis]XP_016845833.1 uncharacterized protein LOC107982225 [Nasonia vitripennis]
MAMYDLNAIPMNNRLRFDHRQYQLTATSAFKVLETGMAYGNFREQFFIRITRNVMYRNRRPYIIYVDITKADFDQIMMRARRIQQLLQNRSHNKVVYQNSSIHVWTQGPRMDGPSEMDLLCFVFVAPMAKEFR